MRARLATGAIPTTNALTFAEPDHPWINHQWLPATAFTLAYDAAGFASSWALRLALVVATAAFVMAAARRLGASPEIAAVSTVLGAWAAALRFVERPLLASNLALAIVVWACACALDAARAGRRALPWIVTAGASTSIAIHLYAGALFSVLSLAAFAAALLLDPVLARVAGREPVLSGALRTRGAGALLVALAVAVVAAGALLAVYHPYGLAVLGVPLQMADSISRRVARGR